VTEKIQKYNEIILPILTYIQSHLEESLSLEQLSQKAGLSPYYFHRMFHDAVGESLKSYTTRLKLEKAAFGITYWDMKLTDISLEVGFSSYETFSRSFKKHFDVAPKDYKLNGFTKVRQLIQPKSLNEVIKKYEMSKVTIKKMQPILVLYKRHIGSYLDVDVSFYNDLIGFAKDHHVYTGDNLLIGIGHDAPNITPENKMRFDACIEISKAVATENNIAQQQVFSGYYATMTYIGPYGETMQVAYFEMFKQLKKMKNVQIIGLPLIEVYRAILINPEYELNQTDIYIPIQLME